MSVRVVVDDLWLQRFGGHNIDVQELERASTCMADKLMQAGCEIATKLRVLSNCGATVAAAWRAGDADRTKPRNRFRVREASVHSGAAGGSGKSTATAGEDCACLCQKANHHEVAVTGLNETQQQLSRSQMASCVVKRMHGKSATKVLMMAGDELDKVFDSLARGGDLF